MELVGMLLATLLINAVSVQSIEHKSEANEHTLSTFLRASLENFRKAMKEGIPELHVPVLDPYAMEAMTMTEDKGSTRVTVSVSDTSISGLSDFEIKRLDADPKTLETVLELEFNSIRGDGKYLLDGVIYSIFPLTGDGPYWVKGDKINAHGTAKLLKEGNHLQIQTLNLTLTTSNVAGHFDNILGGGELGEIINTLLNQFGKRMLDYYSPKLSTSVTEAFRTKANDELKGMPIADLIPTLEARIRKILLKPIRNYN